MGKIVLSLYDYTGLSVEPWFDAGYECHCYDIEHSETAQAIKGCLNGGHIEYRHADLHNEDTIRNLIKEYKGKVAFLSAFPVCTDMALSGTRHFEHKEKQDPFFKGKAATYAIWCSHIGNAIRCPWYVENPASILSTHWRKPDHKFNPHEYGGYLNKEEAEHPDWPKYIAPYDAYPKETWIWCGGGLQDA